MPYTDLVTVDTLAKAALGEILQDMRDLVLDPASDFYEEATRTIQVVTSDVETYLQRPVIVRRERMRVEPWMVSPAQGMDGDILHETSPQLGPYVQWAGDTEPDGFEAFDGMLEDDVVWRSYDLMESVDAYVGYRRVDQDLPTLQTDLPDLTTLPPVLPFVVQDVATRLCLMRLQQQINGLLGIARTERDIGGLSQRSERVSYQQGEEKEQLQRLQGYRRVSA